MTAVCGTVNRVREESKSVTSVAKAAGENRVLIAALKRSATQPAPHFESTRFPATMDAVKPTIFVVEDDPDISRLVRHHLEAASFTVRLYSTGNLVVLDAERQRPSLFLLDIMVPGKDGLELCRQIRNSVHLSSVPVIFLTAKSSEADRVLGLELGADDTFPSRSARANWWRV